VAVVPWVVRPVVIRRAAERDVAADVVAKGVEHLAACRAVRRAGWRAVHQCGDIPHVVRHILLSLLVCERYLVKPILSYDIVCTASHQIVTLRRKSYTCKTLRKSAPAPTVNAR